MASTVISLDSLQAMKVADLKRELKALGLSTSGNKNDLIERLQQALSTADINPSRPEDLDHSSTELEDNFEGADNVNEDEVLEDDVLLGEDHKHHEGHDINEEELLATKLDSDGLQHDLSTPDIDEMAAGGAPSILLSVKSAQKENGAAKEATLPLMSEDSSSEKGAIKKKADPGVIKKLSQDERLALRAKRFNTSGTESTEDARLKARAERFGIQSKTAAKDVTKSSVSKSIGSAPVDFDRLKKRAERFGTSVSAVMKQIEEKEKILKRKQRFGTLVASTCTDEQERKKLRAERFAVA